MISHKHNLNTILVLFTYQFMIAHFRKTKISDKPVQTVETPECEPRNLKSDDGKVWPKKGNQITESKT